MVGGSCTWEGFSLTDFQELDNETRKIFFTNQISHLRDRNYIKLNYNSTATL